MKYRNIPSCEEFCKVVGSEFLEVVFTAVEYAKNKWQVFMAEHPELLEPMGQNLSATFIHSCIASSLKQSWRGNELIHISDKPNTFEFSVASKYVGRVKRHSLDDKISSYPTEGAEDFWSGSVALEGMELYPIAIGYIWDADTMTIGDPVVTLRQGMDKVVWSYKLTAQEGFGQTRSIALESLPAMPELDISGLVDNDSAKEAA